MNKRIEQLRQKIREATGEEPVFGMSPDCPPEVEEAYLERVLAIETTPKRTLFNLLGELGVELPRPQTLSDRELTTKLWEVINALLGQWVVLGNTDHLSDREMYAQLWNHAFRDEYVVTPHYTVYIDMTQTNEADRGLPIYLKYYATEEQRRIYSRAHPDFKMPPHVEPPRRRDHLIPEDPSTVGGKLN